MWDIICQQNIYRMTIETAFLPAGWGGSVGQYDGYDAQ